MEELADNISNKLIEFSHSKVCFVEKDSGPIGMIALSSMIASKINSPVSVVRVRRDVLRMAVKGGSIQRGDSVVLIQDVLRSGYQTLQAAKIIEKLGATVEAVVVLVDRQEEKDEEFMVRNIQMRSLLSLNDIQKIHSNSLH